MSGAHHVVVLPLICAGSEVICSETVMNPVQMYADDHADSSSADGHDDDEMRFIFTIRLVQHRRVSQGCGEVLGVCFPRVVVVKYVAHVLCPRYHSLLMFCPVSHFSWTIARRGTGISPQTSDGANLEFMYLLIVLQPSCIVNEQSLMLQRTH